MSKEIFDKVVANDPRALAEIKLAVLNGLDIKYEMNEATSHKVLKTALTDKFMKWVETSLGEPKTEGTLTIYYNKMDKPVFSYDTKKEVLNVLQNGLKLEDLKAYGLNIK